MAILKVQVLCDHFNEENEVVELKAELNYVLREGNFEYSFEGQTQAHYDTYADDSKHRYVMAFIELEVCAGVRYTEAAERVKKVLSYWDFGEKGGWNILIEFDYFNDKQTRLGEIEKMDFLLDGYYAGDDEETPF